MSLRRHLLLNSLEILVLSSFAFAQPLYDLLSRNAGFFVARKSEPVDILLLVLFLSFALPGGFILLEVAALGIAPKLQRWAHNLILAVLLAVTFLPVLKRIGRLPAKGWLMVAILVGLALSWLYQRLRARRFSLVFLSPAILLFPALFLFHSSVLKILFEKQNSLLTYPAVPATAPIVMVVFDEFPLASLLDQNRQIDPKLYPNFASLSGVATWFRNATAVSEGTLNAVPTVVDGLYPRPALQLLPNAADHPHTLFTLLGGSYKLNVVENSTRLCPEWLCGRGGVAKTPLRQRLRALSSDLAIIYLYILLPSDLTAGLPDITHSWKDFAAHPGGPTRARNPLSEYNNLADWTDRSKVFKEFVQSIQPSSKPTLNFLHILLPHAPWEFLPSGKKYTLDMDVRGAVGANDRGEDPTQWTNDSWAVIQGYQRHLLQVGMVDQLLGYLLDHLKRVGLYESALIVITADHGACFRPNESRRRAMANNYADIMAIPLLMKAPHQAKGWIDDRNVETIDILPTIADILKIDMPWNLDGRSALNQSFPEKKEKIMITEKTGRLVFGPSMDLKYETVKQKLALFGSENAPGDPYWIRSFSELVGHRVGEVGVVTQALMQCEIDGNNYYSDVNPNSPLLLTHITGRIVHSSWGAHKPLNLAVAVNGRIGAVTETYLLGEDERFSAVVPESVFQPDDNEVNIFSISRSNGRLTLEEIHRIKIPEYQWGNPILFRIGGDAKLYQAEGWYLPEEYITWTQGKQARLVLPISPPKSPVRLRVRLQAYWVRGKVKEQRVRILVNQQMAGEWSFTSAYMHERTLLIPKELFTDPDEVVLTFETPDAVSPVSIGDNSDVRELSISLASLTLTPLTQ